MNVQETMRKILTENDLCVLATVGDGDPHCSLMTYLPGENGTTIYLATDRNTTKYRNLQEHPGVSLLVDTRHRHPPGSRDRIQALTIHGICRAVADTDVETRIRNRFLQLHPQLQTVLDREGSVMLEVFIHSLLLLSGPTDSHYLEFP